MVTAVAYRNALDHHWADGDYDNQMVAVVSVCFDEDFQDRDDADAWLNHQVQRGDGHIIDASEPGDLIAFLELNDALQCARHIRERFGKQVRIGVNLTEFQTTADGQPGSGPDYARKLMEQSEAGGITISAIAVNRITSQVGANDNLEKVEKGWKPVVYFILQFSAVCGYFMIV